MSNGGGRKVRRARKNAQHHKGPRKSARKPITKKSRFWRIDASHVATMRELNGNRKKKFFGGL